LRREIVRLRDHLQGTPKEKESDEYNPTALLADQVELRQARVARLKQWLEQRPEEQIPELQFLSQADWIRQENQEPVTEEEHRVHISALRANAEMRFTQMTFDAVKKYAQAHDGQFPSDLSQLKPYFESSIDEAILQRYMIVPANTLTF